MKLAAGRVVDCIGGVGWGGNTKNILACPGCGVSFCVKCYRLFHKEADIVGMKSKLMKEFKRGK